MRLTYGNLVRGIYLVLFIISSTHSIIHYHTNAVVISILCLIGFIAFDLICILKDKYKPADPINPDLDKLLQRQLELETKFNTVSNDIGLAKIGAAYRR